MIQLPIFLLCLFGLYPYGSAIPISTDFSVSVPPSTSTPIMAILSMSSPSVKIYANRTSLVPSATANSLSHAYPSTIPRTLSLPATSTSDSQQHSGWSPSDIGTMLFGCIASILGVVTLWLTVWLNRRRLRYTADVRDGTEHIAEKPPPYEDRKRYGDPAVTASSAFRYS
ncbi:hypothetical protein N7G274_004348 [Stereocaulon virgatum]|uniref:Uncharacterized protein n=1 Tax=Stereocaulon virgatum TaxID=373712 RepID=A0ABR4AD06_9LECA